MKENMREEAVTATMAENNKNHKKILTFDIENIFSPSLSLSNNG